jgi:hypothetical protein
MEQDIWFHQQIKDDPLPDPKEIRSHVPLHTEYHAILRDNELYHPRVWEGSTLVPGPLLQKAIDFGIDFTAHDQWFIKKNLEHWDSRAGGKLSLGQFEQADTFDEFTLYCALVEGTRMTHHPRAVHLQGPEVLHRNNPKIYHGGDVQLIQTLAELWRSYFCVYAALAVYFIAGNWKQGANWKNMKRRYRCQFKTLVPTASEWMKPEEHERLKEVLADL